MQGTVPKWITTGRSWTNRCGLKLQFILLQDQPSCWFSQDYGFSQMLKWSTTLQVQVSYNSRGYDPQQQNYVARWICTICSFLVRFQQPTTLRQICFQNRNIQSLNLCLFLTYSYQKHAKKLLFKDVWTFLLFLEYSQNTWLLLIYLSYHRKSLFYNGNII